MALTPKQSSARRLCLSWGTHCVITGEVERFKLAVVSAVRAALVAEFVRPEDSIVVTAGVPFNMPGSTNILRVAPCDEAQIFAAEGE